MWAVYIADMWHLEQDDPAVWSAFLEGDFCCQKTEIPGTAIGRDHTGEQGNKKIKNRGGISGLTQQEDSRTDHFLLSPVICAISDTSLSSFTSYMCHIGHITFFFHQLYVPYRTHHFLLSPVICAISDTSLSSFTSYMCHIGHITFFFHQLYVPYRTHHFLLSPVICAISDTSLSSFTSYMCHIGHITFFFHQLYVPYRTHHFLLSPVICAISDTSLSSFTSYMCHISGRESLVRGNTINQLTLY